jgi:hypothetical protein
VVEHDLMSNFVKVLLVRVLSMMQRFSMFVSVVG